MEDFNKFVQAIEEEVKSKKSKIHSEFESFVEKAKRYTFSGSNKKHRSFIHFVQEVANQIVYDVDRNWTSTEKQIYTLSRKVNELNIFEAFENEGPYRDFFVWLMNPASTHKLGDRFTRLFINRVFAKQEPLSSTQPVFEDIQIHKEYENIDFIVIGANFYCAVETKLYGPASSAQLVNYCKILYTKDNLNNKTIKVMCCLDPKIPSSMSEFQKQLNIPSQRIYDIYIMPMNWWDVALCLTDLYYHTSNQNVRDIIINFLQRIFYFVTKMSGFYNREKIIRKRKLFNIYAKNKLGGTNAKK